MEEYYINWKTQIRKGYLELCLLLLIQSAGKIYGLELLERMNQFGLAIKEGTLYPILNRMAQDQLLLANWETQNVKGHPRKFYSLGPQGPVALQKMLNEFEEMKDLVNVIQKLPAKKREES